MTSAQAVWAALILAQCVLVSPVVILLFRKTPMPVMPEYQPIIDELNQLAADLPAKVAAAVTAAEAAGAQNKADTLAAVQAAADAVKGSVP